MDISRIRILGIFLLLLLFLGPGESFASCFGPGTACSPPIVKDAAGNNHYYILSATLCQVQYNLLSALGTVYSNIVTALAPTIHIVLLLYIALFGYGFMMGISGTEGKDFVIRISKLSFVYAFTDPNNQCAFFQTIVPFFTSAMDQMAIFTSGNPATALSGTTGGSGAGGAFTAVDSIVSGQIQMMWKVGAVMFAFMLFGPGFFVSLLIGLGFLFMFKAMITLFKTLGMCLIGLMLCLMLAPIFLCLFLFEQTKSIFDGWLHMMISYIFQPMIIFFYILIAGPLLDISSIINGLLDGNVIVPHAYTFNYIFGSICIPISSYGFNPGPVADCAGNIALQCTICGASPNYPLGLTTPLTINGSPPQSVFYTVTLNTLQWTLMTIATSEFMGKVPELATQLGTLGSALFTPRMGEAQKNDGTIGGGAAKDGGMINLGFTGGVAGGGFAKRMLADPLMKTAGKIALGRRLFSAFNAAKSVGETQANDEMQGLRAEFQGRYGIGEGNIEEVRDMMYRASRNNSTTVDQMDEIGRMVKNSGNKSLKASYEKYRQKYVERKAIALDEALQRAADSARTTADQMDELGVQVSKLKDENLQEIYNEVREDFNYKKAKPIEEELTRAAADPATTPEQMEAIRRKVVKSGSKKLMSLYDKIKTLT